ncbi:MAG TPA: CBS domain-containing protein [Actinophytocola sp.]|uniref:CBS domain-containing protein n=1 Tax=Actinophytocola sp. TaxID=1872138 RepID=UPI002DBDBC0C|nr:CBS domain-containing protein [Actinophytocola sp.]HEU5472429.1 CBS domain-containing protein [Actinophytocola sp.]
MTTARDIMTANPTCVRTSDTVLDAARRMAEESIGALPVCGEDNRLKGMLTDRDIVVKVLAEGKDPRAMHAGEVPHEPVVTVRADDDVATVLQTMKQHQVRRVPVLDEQQQLVGIVAQADIARTQPDAQVGDLVEAVSNE